MMKTTTEANAMKQYLVYQLPFESALKRDVYFMDANQIAAISDQFELVGKISARNLDEAFRVGNFVCESDRDLIEIVGEMSSISVGDIIVDVEADCEYVVASFGFEQIVMKEAV
jgi:hypothetical protein